MEGDGFGVHSQRDPFERDRLGQNLLVLASRLPMRFTWRRLCRAPVGVVIEVHAALTGSDSDGQKLQRDWPKL